MIMSGSIRPFTTLKQFCGVTFCNRSIAVSWRCAQLDFKNPPFSCEKELNRLFDYPKKKDGKTDAASKAGMRVIRRLHSNPRLNNHSFRHYFVDKTREAENYLPAGAVDYVTGHSIGDSERSKYGHGYGLKQVYQGLLKLDFSFLTSFD